MIARRRALVALVAFVASGCRAERQLSTQAAFRVADSLRMEGRSAQADSAYHSLRMSLASTGDTASLWKAQLWWAYELTHLAKRDSAREALRGAQALTQHSPAREGWTQYVLSVYYDRQGMFDSSIAAAERMRALSRVAHDSVLEVQSYNATGRAYSLTGRYREALVDHEREVSLAHAVGGDTSRLIATAWNEIGIDYKHFGRFTDATHAYGRALALERRRRNPEGIARVQSNLANLYVATGDFAPAETLMLASLREAERIGLVRGEVYLHNDLADLYRRSGNPGAARHHLERALELNRNGFLAYGRVQSLDDLGALELALGNPGRADSALNAARMLADASHFGREQVSARALLSSVAVAERHPASALRWAGEAVHLADSLGDPDAQAQALDARAAALETAGRRSALDAYRGEIALLESWRGRLAVGDLRMGVADPRLAAYEGAIRLLVKHGHATDAFDVAEHARARMLLDLIGSRDAGETHSRETELREELRLRFAARAEAPNSARPAMDRELERLATALRRAEQEARDRDPAGGARYPAPLPLAAIRAALLRPDRALLGYFWGDRAVYGWWVTATDTRVARLGAADSLASLADFLRASIDDPAHPGEWTVAARRAYRQLIEPLAPGRVREVIVVADGPLSYLPIETLLAPGAALPWGATTRFVYAPSASVLTALQGGAARPTPPRTVLALGDPEPANGAVAGVGGERSGGTPLPFAAREARDAAAAFAGASDVLTGSDATLVRWRALHPERYRYLHFAAHARVSETRAGAASLLLADSTLDLPSIRALRLDADLVTLSACETALGPRVRGEGVVGLPHAFLASGARGVVVSLWRVGDHSSADFMHDFYRELSTGRAPAEALRLVRRSRMQLPGSEGHPSRWAAFVLVGGLTSASR